MGIKRTVELATIGIAAVAGFWAIVAPHWVVGELFLFAACTFIVQKHLAKLKSGRGIQVSSFTASGSSSWLADSQPYDSVSTAHAFHPWDFDQLSAKPRTTVIGENTRLARTFCPHNQSVEQIANEILTQAFRQPRCINNIPAGGGIDIRI
jgi:hypothetical protein